MTAIALSVSSLISAQTAEAVLSEDFESGSLPDGWTQEFVIGQRSWAVEGSALSNPDGAASGKYRIALRNATNQRQGFRTRLILPPVDITGLDKPIVSFSFAQAPWAGDFDTLRVLYRPTATEEWVVLEEFSKAYSTWNDVMVELGVPSATAQIAFDGTDNLGRGIVLDDILIRTLPECRQPEVRVDKVSDSEATLFWNGSFDTKQYHIRVSEEQLSDIRLNAGRDEFLSEPYDELVHGSLNMLTLENLKLGTKYYVYIRALCGSENSLWSNEVSFSTLQKVTVPYEQDFNLSVTGMPTQDIEWHFGTSYNQDIPFVNTNILAAQLSSYSLSATTCLVFGLSDKPNYPIPEGNYAYAVSPEILTDDISALQVTFNGGRSTYYTVPDDVALIVGVMIDPDDYSTFTPIDTVWHNEKSSQTFEEYIVPLTGAPAEAKYVALVSDFDTKNSFYVDDFVLAPIPPCAKAKDQTFVVESATEVTVDWNSSGATEGDILFVTSRLDQAKTVEDALAELDPSEYILKQAMPKPAEVTDLQPMTTYFVYVRNKCGDDYGAWSSFKQVSTPAAATLTAYFDFELDTQDPNTYYLPNPTYTDYKLDKRLTVITDNSMPPCNSTDAKRDGSMGLHVRARSGKYCFVVFPSIEDINQARVSFWGTVRKDNLYGHVILGVMENLQDTASFVPVDTVRLTADYWSRFSFDMDNYTFDGKFLTLRYEMIGTRTDGKTSIETYIDDLTIEPLPACDDPRDIKVVPGATDVTISWDKTSAEAWNVRISKEPAYDRLADTDYEWIFNDTVTDPEAQVGMLNGNNSRYFYYLQTICRLGDAGNDWPCPF